MIQLLFIQQILTEYTAAVTYNLCNGETATVTDTVLVEITPTPIPVAVEDEIFICDGVETKCH